MLSKTSLPTVAAAFFRCHPLPAGAGLVVGVSGGADSMALLHFLCENRKAIGLGILTCAHLNHMLRGAESDGDQAFVAQFCRERSIPFVCRAADVAALAAAQKRGIEETARNIRTEYLLSVLNKTQAYAYLTAHNADDNAETVLLHLLRGSGLSGLSGMAGASGCHWRPLLAAGRAEILEYLSAHAVPYREDASNADTRYTRNKIRRELMPLLRAFNPKAQEALNRLAVIARRDDDCLAALAAQMVYTDGNGLRYALKTELLKAHPALASRALALLCPAEKRPPFLHLEAMRGAVARNSNTQLPGGLKMLCRKGKVTVV